MKKIMQYSIPFLLTMFLLYSPEVMGSVKTERGRSNVTNVKKSGQNADYMHSPVSALSKIRFRQNFADAKKVKWSRSGNFDVATFTQNGQRKKAYFGMNSRLIGTITHKYYTDIPRNVLKEINYKYSDYSLGPVIYFNAYEPNITRMVLSSNKFENSDSYYIELVKGNKKIVLRVDELGDLEFYRSIS